MQDFLPEVMSNQFGNYLCQKIIEVSTESELKTILNVVQLSAFEIATSMHGTRAMQTLVETTVNHAAGLNSELHAFCATL